MSNAINPEHYNRLNPQPKDVIRAWGLNFNLGSAVKYISRAGHKDDIVQDLKKAQEFIQFEIDAIEGTRAERKDKPKHEDFMDALLHGLFGSAALFWRLLRVLLKKRSATTIHIQKKHLTGESSSPCSAPMPYMVV